MSSTFAGLGGTIDVVWDIGLEGEVEAEQELLSIAGYLENIELPLFAARRIAREDMQKHFDDQIDPAGAKWTPLDEDYLRNKLSLGYPDMILQRETDLIEAATSEEGWIITGDTLFFNTEVLPEYGLLHQTGTGEDNVGQAAEHRARQRVGGNPEGKVTSGHESLGIGRGMALPRRAFIGLSDEAEAKVWAVFDHWFENAGKTVAINPITGVAQSRTASGQFGPKL